MTIDAHAHMLPKDFPEGQDLPVMEVIDGDTARTLLFGKTRFRAKDVFFEVDRRLEALDDGGIDEEILSPMPPLLNYTLPIESGLSLSRHVNEITAEMVSAGGGRIHGLGMVPMQDPEIAAAELAGLAELGLRGVEVASHIAGITIGDPRFEVVFREADRLGLSVLVHSLPRMDEESLAPDLRGSIGVGLEGARGAASLVLGALAQEEGTLTSVLFTHAAGGLPLMLARADFFWGNADPETRSALPPSELAKRFYYDSMVFDPRGLRFIIDYLGADRIVLGSDFPAMARRMPLSDTVDDLELSAEVRDLVLSENARRYLGVTAPAEAQGR